MRIAHLTSIAGKRGFRPSFLWRMVRIAVGCPKMVEDIMRIATAAYPITWLNSWDEYEQKLDNWVVDAADHGAEFLVFSNMHRWSFHRSQERKVPQ